jgi:hypothetical protein
MKGTRHSEEQIIAILKQRGRIDDGGVMPTARDHGADLLPLEGEVWRDGQ